MSGRCGAGIVYEWNGKDFIKTGFIITANGILYDYLEDKE